jgi:hypothetical protein
MGQRSSSPQAIRAEKILATEGRISLKPAVAGYFLPPFFFAGFSAGVEFVVGLAAAEWLSDICA